MKICIFGDARAVHLQRIVPGLIERGLSVHIVCHKPVEVAGATVERYRIPAPGLTNPRRWAARRAHYLSGFLRRFDVVQVHFLHEWGFGYTPDILDAGCFVATPWGSDIVAPPGEEPPDEEAVARRRTILQRADGVTAWGPRFARMVADYADIDVDDIALLPLGVDLKLFKPIPSTSPSGLLRVGYFKGFRPVYGATYWLRAIRSILEVRTDVRFDMVGDGPDLERCKILAGTFGVEASIAWHPRQPHRNLPHHLAGWAVSVIPSLCESFGVAALESAAMGVPVVASDVGGLPDTVRHEETGLLVPPRSPEQLADAVLTLLSDEPLRQRLAYAGRAMVEREYEWQSILDQWVTTYEAAREAATVMV